MPKLEPQAFTDLAPPSLNAEDAAKVATASISTTPNPYPSPESALSAGALGGDPKRATTGQGGTGNGAGVGTSGGGADHGSGSGVESSGFAVALTQASYRETPRPAYPETARRDGREGRVLLRVLVDDQGKPKRVEINNSSGSDSLDSAAVEAIKRWRFHPARYGEKPIESWLRIPIEFRLADAKF
ncbi:MAG TPA: energy transducer TonB [Candidatus Binatia bacterium]|nr:energy transducer TonB [Candidatus Binatia bacterium]